MIFRPDLAKSFSIKEADRRVDQEGEYLRKLQRLKTGLRQDLLTGKVSVEPLLATD